MFAALSRFTTRYRIAIIAVWLVAAAGLFVFSPKLADVGVTDESQFLPQDTQSAIASRLLDEKFASTGEAAAGNGIIVIHNADGLNAADMQKAQTIHDWLVSDSAPAEIQGVTSIFESEVLRTTLISTDQTTMIMSIDFSVGSLSDAAKSAVSQIRDYIQQNYPDENIYFTGKTGLFQDMFASVQETVSRTTLVTVILVAILLLIIYRSPVAIILPLVAIGCSFAVSVGIIGFLGAAGAKFSTLAEVYLVVIIFGVGTDYCLFIVSRFREELRQKERDEAQSHSIRTITPVIAASALTVIVAFLSLGISQFGMNQTTGYSMAIGVAITLLAGLTLVPALMSLFGKYLFWPVKVSVVKKEGGFGWHTIGNWVSRHPVITAVPILVVLILPYIALPDLNRSADIINQLPQNSESVKGYKIMTEHFTVGELSPSYVLIESKKGDITGSTSLKAIEDIAQSLEKVEGVSRVSYYSSPAAQLSGLALQFRNIGDALGQGSGMDQLSSLQAVGQSLQSMALQYPGIIQSPNFQQAGANLGQITVISGQIAASTPENIPALLGQMQQTIYKISDNLNGLVSEFKLESNTPFTTYLYAAYFSTDKTIARINVVFAGDPNSTTTMEAVARVRDTARNDIDSSTLAGSSRYVGGESAVRADIMLTNDADFGKVVGLAIAGIFIVIAILLRSIIAPLYMVITVMLNYGTTLGVATWLFLDMMNRTSISYMLPLLIFVILVALGADYNIFLVSRIREEAQTRPIKDAVSHAVANTGGVITACGIILAGTFATLMTSPLEIAFQIGAMIAAGVLIDTFIVRALLVPAMARLIGRWNWWPSKLFRQSVK
jgi:putative drug exporter of the RND superfamily